MARKKEFDREDALKQAMKTFWDKGYDATTIPDLTEAMKISRSSLYETFGDKQALFIEALSYYMQFIGQRHATIFKNANSVKQGLLDYLTDIINMALYEEYPRGCFFINTATAFNTADKQVQSAIKHGAETVEQELIAFLEDGKYEGQIEGNKDTHALARYFLGLICGMNVIARVQKDRAILEDMVKIALEGL